MKHPDLSVGRRLGAGFGLLLAMLVGLVVAVAGWQADSAREQRAFTERSAPLSARADELERSILYLAITLRSYLVLPHPEQASRYHERLDRVRRALVELRDHPKDSDSERSYSLLEPAVQAYLADADEVVRAIAQHRIEPSGADSTLAVPRERALSRVREFSHLQDEKAQKALTAMAKARERVSRGLALASAAALLLSLLVMYLTTQSIRRPTRELLKVARALTTGDLQPALGWAPARRAGEDAPQPRSEMLQLAHAFGAAAVALQRREQGLRAHRDVATAVASALDRNKIASGALSIIVEHVGADAAVLYWRDTGSGDLVPLASHGIGERARRLRRDEGIPGEAARSGLTVVRRGLSDKTALQSVLGPDAPASRAAAAIPIVFGSELLGVMLVASLEDVDEEGLSFLTAVAPEVGVGLKNAQAYEDIRLLLEQVQEKNERIEQQNEELQAQNEEIQGQHEEIQAQSEEIQAQSEELQAQNEQLREQADELTARAAMLSEADERKNEFLGFLAHELRNPTSAIANGLFILGRVEPGSATAINAQAIMQRQTRQLTRLIDDLLDTTRISRGKIQLDRQAVNFIDVVRETAADYEAAMQVRKLTYEMRLPDDDVWVHGDRTRLSQIIGNLLSNAIKFSEDGTRVSVEAWLDRHGGMVELRVADEGCGIEPALLPQLFTPFTQGTTSLARTRGGLGLGLALVKSLVELHDGTVQAHSDGAGRGAVFVVRLPLSEAPPAIAIRPKVLPLKRRVLIIEDNADAAESLRAGAELQGHEVLVAHDGNTGLELALSFRPQVILCDIGLPGIDGYEVARRLRAQPELQGVFIIAVSGYAAARDKARAAVAGFDIHVAKPLKMDELDGMLAELEQGSRVAADGRA
ncbi:MAG TPA: ATP-binding protein [Burkholderiales bacterium]|nr:ATP-binding protein [Burkholderiales bacterium]